MRRRRVAWKCARGSHGEKKAVLRYAEDSPTSRNDVCATHGDKLRGNDYEGEILPAS